MRRGKIICDYCGSVIDTSRHDRCPGCGAAYGSDKEWKEQNQSGRPTDVSGAGKSGSENNGEGKSKRKKFWTVLLFSVTVAAVLLATAGIVMKISEKGDYTRSGKLNEFEYEHYERVDYSIQSGGVIFDRDGVRISAEGIYLDEDEYSRNLKIGYVIENGSGKDIQLSFRRIGINGLADTGSSGYMYGHFRRGSSVTLYDWIYNADDVNLREIIFSGISFYSDDGKISYESTGCTAVTTDCGEPKEIDVPEIDPVYDNNGITVINAGKSGNSFEIWVINSTDDNFFVTSSDIRVNGERVNSYGLYNEVLPAGYIMKSQSLWSYDEAFRDARKGDSVEVSLSFRCEEDPSADFSTGYFRVR